MQCRHLNALPDIKVLLKVTDRQIENGFTYSKSRYPMIIFRVYRCDRCNGLMEEAISLLDAAPLDIVESGWGGNYLGVKMEGGK